MYEDDWRELESMGLGRHDDTRSVFDPTLPEEMLPGLRAGAAEIRKAPPGTRPRLLRTRRERAITGGIAFTATLGAMAVCDFVLDATTLSIAVGILGLFLYIPVRLGEGGIKGELSSLGFGLLWSPWGIGMSVFGGAFFSFLLVHLLRFVSFVFFVGKVAEYVVPADRFVDRAELGYGARGKLRRVQGACDRVARAQRLIPAFDGRSALIVLREQEWLVACDLARIAPLAEEVRRLEAEAVSDRVRAAMHARVRALEAANRQVDRRLDQIAAYVRPVDAALTAYREWEQLSRLADDTDDYTDLLAHSGSDPAGPLPHDLRREDALRAARAAFEERVREAHEAADRLASAVR